MAKTRVTVTVDDAALRAARAAVGDGRVESLSSWVNSALVEKAARERRSAALRIAVEEYEAEHGVITDAEITAQRRVDRASATVVRGRPAKAATGAA